LVNDKYSFPSRCRIVKCYRGISVIYRHNFKELQCYPVLPFFQRLIVDEIYQVADEANYPGDDMPGVGDDK